MKDLKDAPPHFCITIEFDSDSGDAARIFKTMSGLVDAFQVMDRALIGQLSSKIDPVLMLENIESGSIKAFFTNRLKEIDDDALKSGDWKKVVGTFLVKGKHVLLSYLDKEKGFSDSKDIDVLEGQLVELSKQSNIYKLSSHQKPDRKTLMAGIYGASEALRFLGKTDKAFYDSGDGMEVSLSAVSGMSEERIEELLTKRTMSSKMEMILKVKKPDYLGKSRWELRHDTRTFLGTMSDEEWVKEFQARKIDVRPGDAIRGMVEVVVNYGENGEVVSQKYFILKVYEVIRSDRPEQGGFFVEENKE
jgi:hypothetical protein